jgi:hypothetical protein
MIAPGTIRTNQRIRETGASRQTARDNDCVQQRIAACAAIFPDVKARLKGGTKDELLKYAEDIAQQRHLPPPDRVCRRSRDAVICWFCANAPNVLTEVTRKVVLPPLSTLFPDLAFPFLANPTAII